MGMLSITVPLAMGELQIGMCRLRRSAESSTAVTLAMRPSLEYHDVKAQS
jgi:hypothetical protein